MKRQAALRGVLARASGTGISAATTLAAVLLLLATVFIAARYRDNEHDSRSPSLPPG